MTEPKNPDEPNIAESRFLHGRGFFNVFGPGLGAAGAALLIYAFQRQAPAFEDVLKPVYFVIAAAFVIFTGRALRARSETRRSSGDRRRADRRARGDER